MEAHQFERTGGLPLKGNTMQLPKLNCNGCRKCCLGEMIVLMPGDDPTQYKTKMLQGKHILKHGKDGNCVYLGKRGCQIYNRQPAMCRMFDCRKYALVKQNDTKPSTKQQTILIEEGKHRLIKSGLYNDKLLPIPHNPHPN